MSADDTDTSDYLKPDEVLKTREFLLTDDQGNEHSYEASDMRMALVVHQQLVGSVVQKAEEI